LYNSSLCEKMKTDGLAHAENFTDDKIAKSLITVYQNLMK